MKEQIEQAVAISIAKKAHRVQAESLALESERIKNAHARPMPDLLNRRFGTISLSWNKAN